MHKLENNNLPQIFRIRFVKTDQDHSYEIKSVKKRNYFLPRVSKFVCQNSLVFRGTKTWNEIDNEQKNQNFGIFKKRFKQKLLEHY